MQSFVIKFKCRVRYYKCNPVVFTDVRLFMLHQEITYMAMCVRRFFKMVHERNEEAGNEASKREQNCTNSKAGEGQPDDGPVPVKAEVRPLEHPVKTKQEDCAMNFGKVSEQD